MESKDSKDVSDNKESKDNRESKDIRDSRDVRESRAPPERRFICSHPGCVARYNRQWKLDAHLSKHTGLKPFTCGEGGEGEGGGGGCGKSFASRYHLDRHRLTHTGTRPVRCAAAPACAETFTTRSNMLRHCARKHSAAAAAAADDEQKKKYACAVPGCALVFRKNKQLRAHMCERHTLPPPYRCAAPDCGARFSCASKLRRHGKTHDGYPCSEAACAFTGKTWTELLAHRRDAHRRAHPCRLCGKTFRDAWFLQQHLRVHSDVRVVLRCPRDGCARSFTTESNLRSHVDSFHEERRPYACAQPGCGKTFAARGGLRRHAAVHDPGRRRTRRRGPTRSLASRLSGFKPDGGAGRTVGGGSRPGPGPGPGLDPAAGLQVDCALKRFAQTALELGQ